MNNDKPAVIATVMTALTDKASKDKDLFMRTSKIIWRQQGKSNTEK